MKLNLPPVEDGDTSTEYRGFHYRCRSNGACFLRIGVRNFTGDEAYIKGVIDDILWVACEDGN